VSAVTSWTLWNASAGAGAIIGETKWGSEGLFVCGTAFPQANTRGTKSKGRRLPRLIPIWHEICRLNRARQEQVAVDGV
jgi:hypothetical protein